MSSDPVALPAPLADAQTRFAEWRSRRVRRTERIPAVLWRAAARCAARFGVHPTARALGLDSGALKRQMAPTPDAPFVELIPSLGASPPECILELENSAGAKLRIELRGPAVPDIIELAHRFGRDEA